MGKLREDWWTSLQRSKEREIKAWEGEENLFIYKVMDYGFVMNLFIYEII